jgi:LIVCS family branched-chain amino acid:cation transporter
MRKFFESVTIKTGLAIFAMLFGAGNLIFPCSIGILSGNLTHVGLFGFLLSGVLIPIAGFVGMVFFDGNYHSFFERIGVWPGRFFVFICMLIIGPLLVMPRIITFSYETMRPFIGNYVPLFIFSTVFLIIVFICSFKKNSILDLIGKILSPIKLFFLILIIIVGFLNRNTPEISTQSVWQVFSSNLLLGYNTLDLLGAIFFAYIIISMLKNTNDNVQPLNGKKLTKITLISSLIGGSLLAIIYIGMGYVGAWHGQGLEVIGDEGKMFIHTLLRILGSQGVLIKGALIISLTVFFACLTTIISLASVVTEYIHNDVSNKKISYIPGLITVIVITWCISQFELGTILQFSKPLMYITYPVLIVLTLCNIAYKLWGFSYIKTPVLATLVISLAWFGPDYIKLIKANSSQIVSNK